MSGGSLDYVCYKVDDAARYVKDKEVRELLRDVANLLHDLEWSQCDDISEEDYLESLKNFKEKWINKSENAAPCKVGDKIFFVMPELYGNQVIQAFVDQIILTHGETQILVYFDIHPEGRLHTLYDSFFGKTVFLTYEEALSHIQESKYKEAQK